MPFSEYQGWLRARSFPEQLVALQTNGSPALASTVAGGGFNGRGGGGGFNGPGGGEHQRPERRTEGADFPRCG